MSRFPSFLEYLNDKGAVVDKPETEQVPDYHGPDEKTPPNSKVPYKTPLTAKTPEKGEKGFAELGDDKLVYKPDTSVKYDTKKDVMKEYFDNKGKVREKAKVDINADYDGSPASAPKGGNPYIAKSIKAGEKALGELGNQDLVYEPNTQTAAKVTKTEGFLNRTKDMTLAEFTKYMLKECGCGQISGDDLPYVTAYSTGKIQPHPPEAIKYISTLAGKNSGILENLVGTMVDMGYLNTLLRTIFSYPQAYEELTSLFSDDKEGPSRCDSFVGAMNNSYGKFLSDQEGLYESVSGPIGFEDEENPESEEDFEDEDSDSEESDEDLEDEDHLDSEDDLGSEEDDEEFSDEEDSEEDMEDEEGDEPHDSVADDLEGEEFDDEGESHEDFGPEEEPTSHREKRLKKKFAHDHLLNAMKKHEFMRKSMGEI